jgi:hypothetical protein
MEPERLDNKLPIQKCPHRFAKTETRPPLLSSATRLSNPGFPGCARLAGVNAQPPFGVSTFSYSFKARVYSYFSDRTIYNKSTH